jgi:hypothetical protein
MSLGARHVPSHSFYKRAKFTLRKGKEENAMQIIDAQIHLWGTGLPSNLAHRQVTAFTPEEAIGLMDEGGVGAGKRDFGIAASPPPSSL